ncbi:D-2-hydroxyacid dehydrogenase [Acholeplasma vituli]|uniref:D-2-hydroxyacid dehydrogenase n=1 Tax=Paracholeplasma vituli TaxID=69473 RepID=A0ABT2PXT7_9MOLU|nr:D-2-hydroxyacid dehydrogenase [Paracholeplasma vituli]MCU0105543.1 D-2-hydroxyacid dehydrogenase [Paracholeplasma vituli]
MKVFIQPKVLDNLYIEKLKSTFPKILFTDQIDPNIEAVIMYPAFMNKANLSILPRLRFAQSLMVGYNQVDIQAIKDKGIQFANAKDVYAITIAEDIITKILVLNRNVKKYIRQMDEAIWKPHRFEPEIYGSTVGFLGSGSLASAAAVRLKAFGAKVISYRKSDLPNPMFDETYFGDSGLKTVLQKSDYIVITLPLNEYTNRLIDQEKLSWMKKDAVLINVGRGEVVDQDALIEALQNGQIRGAGLDVMTPEPLPKESPLWKMDNVFITPHNAPSSPYMMSRLYDLIEENLKRFIENKPLKNIVTF